MSRAARSLEVHPTRAPVRAAVRAVARRGPRRSSSPPAAPAHRASPRPPTASSRDVGRARRRRPRRPPRPSPLTVGLGYIPSVQFAQFYLAQQAGYYARRRPRRHAPEQDRPRPHHARSARAPSTSASATARRVIPAVSQGIPVVYTATIYGTVPGRRPRQGRLGHHDRGRPARARRSASPASTASSWIMLQALLKSAGLTTDDVDDRRVPGLRPGGRAPAGRGRRRDRLRQQRADPAAQARASSPSCSRSTTSCRCPGPGLVTGTATLAAKRDALAAFTAATLRGDGRDRRRSPEGPRRDVRGRAGPRHGPELQRQILDATIATWKNPRTDAPYGSIDRDGLAAVARLHDRRSAWCRTRSPWTSWWTSRCCRSTLRTVWVTNFEGGSDARRHTPVAPAARSCRCQPAC